MEKWWKEQEMVTQNLSKTNLTSDKKRPPNLPFLDIKNDICKKQYDLSIVFCDNELSHKLNKEKRGLDKPTNVLSFPLTENSGEIFLDLEKIKKETKDFEMSYKNLVLFLYIHGLLHLIGHDHGTKMETLENKFFKKYKIS